MENEILLLPAVEKDAALISQLAERIWKVHYIPIIGSEQVEYMLRKGYEVHAIIEQMKFGEQYFLVEKKGEAIGYISFTKKEAGTYFLNKFYLDISEQGKGIGKKVFQLATAHYPDLKTLRLQVNRMNYKTINFYFRLGFTIELAKDFYIGEGYSMDDYVMIYHQSHA